MDAQVKRGFSMARLLASPILILAITHSPDVTAEILSFEYCWDAVTAPGNGIVGSIQRNTTFRCAGGAPGLRDYVVCEFEADIDLADKQGISLHSGHHTLNIRVQGAGGWGPVQSRPWWISRPQNYSIVSAEWFFDQQTDPGKPPRAPQPEDPNLTQRTQFSNCEIGSSVPEEIWTTLELPVGQTLLPDIYRIGFRLKDSEGFWGPVAWETVLVLPSSPITEVGVTAKCLIGDGCALAWRCGDLPDDQLLASKGNGSYEAEVDLAAFGIDPSKDDPLCVRLRSDSGGTLVPAIDRRPPEVVQCSIESTNPQSARIDWKLSDGSPAFDSFEIVVDGKDKIAINDPEARQHTFNVSPGNHFVAVVGILGHPLVEEGIRFRSAEVSCCCLVVFKRGDTDTNGSLEITDPINLLGFIFLGEEQPKCFDAADADDNGTLEITDAIVSLGFLFLGDPPPPAPGPTACGPDPTADPPGADFGCEYPPASCQ